MKSLSLRGYDQLRALQAVLRDVTHGRNTALRIFIASRHSTTPEARREFWLEFSWLDQEYRSAVSRLAQFCSLHGDSSTNTR